MVVCTMQAEHRLAPSGWMEAQPESPVKVSIVTRAHDASSVAHSVAHDDSVLCCGFSLDGARLVCAKLHASCLVLQCI